MKTKSEKVEKEYKGQFPSKNCECHFQKPYGFVPEADCPEHDTKQFLDFIQQIRKEERGKGYGDCLKELVSNEAHTIQLTEERVKKEERSKVVEEVESKIIPAPPNRFVNLDDVIEVINSLKNK